MSDKWENSKKYTIKVTDEEIERLTREELADLIELRLYKSMYKDIQEAREESKVDS